MDCKGSCGKVIGSSDSIAYDLSNPECDINLSNASDFGPYCEVCFAQTHTGQLLHMIEE